MTRREKGWSSRPTRFAYTIFDPDAIETHIQTQDSGSGFAGSPLPTWFLAYLELPCLGVMSCMVRVPPMQMDVEEGTDDVIWAANSTWRD